MENFKNCIFYWKTFFLIFCVCFFATTFFGRCPTKSINIITPEMAQHHNEEMDFIIMRTAVFSVQSTIIDEKYFFDPKGYHHIT